MQRHSIGAALILAAVLLAPGVDAQQATERFIPVGQSPGISGKYSYIGKIEQVDPQKRTILVAGPEGSRTIEITDATKIWLDRTQQRKSCESGAVTDLRPGLRVEVKYADYAKKEKAEWIKMVLPPSQP